MEPGDLIIYGLALVLGFMLFRLAAGNGWHWALGLFLALVPLGLTLGIGTYGLLFSAAVVGAAYKANL